MDVDSERPGEISVRRVLLAEDGPFNQEVAVSLLEERGHTVVVVENGKEALAALEKEAFDLVLMDVQMPKMDGLEATVAIREKEKATGAHIPIIAMTAHAMMGDRERCLEAGMDDYLSKPFRSKQLYEIVEGTVCSADTPHRDEGGPETDHPLDWDGALDRLGANVEILKDLAGLFQGECPKMMKEIREAISKGDTAELRRTAHTLKGSADLFMARPVVEAAFRLETMGREENLDGAEEAWSILEGEIDRLLKALEEYL